MSSFEGKKAFITGGSSGIGKALAEELARQGAHVWIAARREAVLEQALVDIHKAARSPDQNFGYLTLDVGDAEAVNAGAKTVLEGLGGLDLLINNAGIARPAYLHEHTPELFESMMRVNYFGTVNVTMAFLDHFRSQGAGHVANVSSTLGFLGIFGYAAYAASKFAVTGFSDCLRQDLLPYGVGVTVLFPADTDTPQLAYENQFKPPETKAIAGNAGTSQPEDVACALLDGVAAGTFHVVPGFMNKATYYAVRYAPWLVHMIADADLMKAHRSRTSAG
jgi:3-dehydrosphinganine reductase